MSIESIESTHINQIERLTTDLLALEMDQQLPHQDTISLDDAIAVLEDLVRERNFFGGHLQAEVVNLIRHLPEKDSWEIVSTLNQLIAQLPNEQQQELKLFLEVLHRVNQFKDVSYIANSMTDIFCRFPSDPRFNEVGLVININFSEVLITNFSQLIFAKI